MGGWGGVCGGWVGGVEGGVSDSVATLNRWFSSQLPRPPPLKNGRLRTSRSTAELMHV